MSYSCRLEGCIYAPRVPYRRFLVQLDADILNRSTVEYTNFTPDRDQKILVTRFVRRAMLKAPARARVKLDVSLAGDFFSVAMSVQSVPGTFDASAVGETLIESLDLLYEDILAKFNVWKSNRFTSEQGIAAS